MSRFTSPLRLEDTGVARNGREIFRVLESFTYEVGAEGSGLYIHVPVGFETDFTSVPWMFWSVIAPTGPHGKAAVLHDFLYRKASGFSKVLGDAIFLEALEVLGVSWWRRTLMYWGVSYFGHSSYRWEAPAPPSTEIEMLNSRSQVKEEFKQADGVTADSGAKGD